jgi:hypothetical protein
MLQTGEDEGRERGGGAVGGPDSDRKIVGRKNFRNTRGLVTREMGGFTNYDLRGGAWFATLGK